jgi:hypothetical protein
MCLLYHQKLAGLGRFHRGVHWNYAMRRAMLAYMEDTSNQRHAYPAYWAPFEVVGEGAAR